MRHSIIPENLTGKSLYDFLVKNEGLIFHAKKSAIKEADESFCMPMFVNEKGQVITKAELTETEVDPTKIKVVAVINTTNWYDSHGDVHIPGLWKKSLSDNKKAGFYLLNAHQKNFEDVIAESCVGETKSMAWKDLGINAIGNTEALLFTGIIDQERNEYMFGQYQKGYVKKHSVGMRYVKMVTCINDEDYPVQLENWEKYIDMVANKSDAEDAGYFWAILEAQVVEGSAVLFASNCVTPTLEASLLGTKNEPLQSTQEEPPSNKTNTPVIGCPNCDYLFVPYYDQQDAVPQCPNCGQFVSPQSTSIMLLDETINLEKALEEINFF